jgi:DNA-binding CsgD family transcriptional regulator/PAS domain-containing protein
MTSHTDILPAIRRLYDAATDADKWPAFLEEVARTFGADGAHIIRVQPHEQALSFSVLYGYDEFVRKRYAIADGGWSAALSRFEQHFSELMPTDPRVQLVRKVPSRPFSCRLAFGDAELHGSRMYRDILAPAGVEYSMVVSIPEDDGTLIMHGVFRGRRSTYFKEPEVEAFGELIPHVKQAVALSEHLARVDLINRIAFEALDGISIGILLLDERASVVHANAAARRIIDLADGISLHNGVLALHSRDENATLRRAIWDAIAEARAGRIASGEALAVTRLSGAEPFPALVATLWGNHLRYGLGRLDRPLAVMFVTIPEEPQEAPAELLRRLFGLTLAEARLCERLVLGRTVEEAAKDLGIATDTARVHLKHVFDKTGVGRQAELVAKILATPVWLRHRPRNELALATP